MSLTAKSYQTKKSVEYMLSFPSSGETLGMLYYFIIKSFASPFEIYPTVLMAFPLKDVLGNNASSQISLKIF
jgi:hypothetical protein